MLTRNDSVGGHLVRVRGHSACAVVSMFGGKIAHFCLLCLLSTTP